MRPHPFLISITLGLSQAWLVAQDDELTNHQCGIDVVWGGTKGTAYQEEYYFHDKPVFDQKQVWIRDDTPIMMSHNAANCKVTATSGRNRDVVGANGPDGIANSGDEGRIRFVVDEIWRVKNWSVGYNGTNPVHPAYTGPFTLASLRFDTGHPVVGTTGAHPTAPITDRDGFYWRGMLDSVGDEWHVLRYADDDQTAGNNFDDAWASDGKLVLLCVNPRTPALTVRATGDGQFYTTPAWTYWTHKIHDQTTFIQVGTGSVSFELRNLYGANITYRINGGAAVNVGSSAATLTAAAFNNGPNTLEYWYTATPSVKRSRTIIKNPVHPGAGENHGNRLWGDARWSAFKSRITRAPYAGLLAAAQNRGASINQNGQIDWDLQRRVGLRLGGSTVWPYGGGPSMTNAIAAKQLGWTATAAGAPRSYAAYAKEMLLESPLCNVPIGVEMPYPASQAIPACDTVYRGYWDVNIVISAAVAYDVLMGGYRSDQVPGGITPIEDCFIRDRLAEWVHHCQIPYSGGLGGMWSMSRNVGATVVAAIMPGYSTSYYGTSGFDGNTTTYPWTPFRTTNLTWRTTFLTHDYTPGTYPDAQSAPFEFTEGMTNIYQTHLIGPATLPAAEGHVRCWRDRTPYTSWSQCGHTIALYALLWKLHAPAEKRPALLNFIDQITAGTLYGSKWTSNSERDNPTRQPFIWCLNNDFPVAVANARSWMQSLPSSDSNSEADLIANTGLLTVFFYDDGRTSSGSSSSSSSSSSGSSSSSSSSSGSNPNPTPTPKSGGGGAPGAIHLAGLLTLLFFRFARTGSLRTKHD